MRCCTPVVEVHLLMGEYAGAAEGEEGVDCLTLQGDSGRWPASTNSTGAGPMCEGFGEFQC